MATLFACPSTTTFGACNHKLANNSNAAHMDPIIKKIFRSLKSVEQYFISDGPGAHVPIMSVTHMYYLHRCADMVILLPLYLALNSCIIYTCGCILKLVCNLSTLHSLSSASILFHPDGSRKLHFGNAVMASQKI